LNDLATAGGTGKPAFIVDGAGTTTQTSSRPRSAKSGQVALPCEYTIPPPTTGKIDPKQVNVEHATDGAASSTFLKVENAAACRDGESNWYYDDDQGADQGHDVSGSVSGAQNGRRQHRHRVRLRDERRAAVTRTKFVPVGAEYDPCSAPTVAFQKPARRRAAA